MMLWKNGLFSGLLCTILASCVLGCDTNNSTLNEVGSSNPAPAVVNVDDAPLLLEAAGGPELEAPSQDFLSLAFSGNSSNAVTLPFAVPQTSKVSLYKGNRNVLFVDPSSANEFAVYITPPPAVPSRSLRISYGVNASLPLAQLPTLPVTTQAIPKCTVHYGEFFTVDSGADRAHAVKTFDGVAGTVQLTNLQLTGATGQRTATLQFNGVVMTAVPSGAQRGTGSFQLDGAVRVSF